MFCLKIFDNMEQCSPTAVRRLLPLVSEQRRQEALRFKHPTGQFACLKSYAMLHAMLMDLGLADADHPPHFRHAAHGKPLLADFPDLHFNISHCKNAIAVAVCDRPVGVDVESFRLPTQQLLEYTMNEKEILQIRQSSHPEQQFALLWTQKEAVVKYLGTGINSSIKDLLHILPARTMMKSSLDEQHGYALTVASNSKEIHAS